MEIVFLIFTLITPRIVILLLWIFSQWFSGVFSSVAWLLIGFIFLPVTLLWYSAVYHWYDNSWGALQFAGLIIALLIDLSPARKRKKRWDKK